MIYLTGESHISCLMLAAAEKPLPATVKLGVLGPGRVLSLDFFVAREDRVAFLPDDVRRRSKALTGRPALFAGDDHLFGFSLGFHAFRICQSETWQRFRPVALGAAGGLHPVSDGAIDAMIEEDTSRQRDFYHALKKLGIPCFAIESPPLLRRLPLLKAGVPPEVIQYVFDRYRAASRAFMDGLGIDVVEFPPEARATDGFLKPRYAALRKQDVRHANMVYGQLMLDRIHGYLKAHHRKRLERG